MTLILWGMAYWLAKSEPSKSSIQDLRRDKRTRWGGVRNYQARNFLRSMKVMDRVLFYHSSEEPVGVVGEARVSAVADPDETQFDENSEYYDSDSKLDEPRWWSPEFQFVSEFPKIVSLSTLKEMSELKDLQLLKKGNRLSVMPISGEHFKFIVGLG